MAHFIGTRVPWQLVLAFLPLLASLTTSDIGSSPHNMAAHIPSLLQCPRLTQASSPPLCLKPEPQTAFLCAVARGGGCEANRMNSDHHVQSRIDFVFLLELTLSSREEILKNVVENITALLRESSEEKYSDIDTRYSIVMYSLERPLVLHVSEFTSVRSLPSFDHLLTASYASIQETDSIAPGLMKYLAVKRVLQTVTSVVDGKVTLSNGTIVKLHVRPDSDLHVIAAINLYNRPQAQGEKGKNKDAIKLARSEIKQAVTDLIDLIPSGTKLTLHFFLDPIASAGPMYLGDPAYSVTYSDCTHFNKALTLNALIRAGETQADSLQAHLLAKGVEIQVRKLSDFGRKDCLLALNPALWGRPDIRAKFHNKCSVVDLPHSSCESGFFCSPLHGCVRRQEGISGARNLVNDILEGKAPLKADFSSSHADLIASGKTPQHARADIVTPADELSITRITSPTDQYNSPSISGEPKIVRWETDKPFASKLIASKEPVVLRNSVVQTWPALTKWNFPYLAKNIGYDVLESVKCTNQFLTFDPDRRVPLKLNISLSFIETNMSTLTFFDCVRDPTACPDGYQGHYYFGSLPDSLRPDVLPGHMLYYTSDDYKAQKQFMWISSAGMITHTHFDQDYNFFVQLIGQKRFTLWSRSQHEMMYVFPRVHPLWHKSQVNFRAPDFVQFPNFAKSKPQQVVLNPGDVLFVPPYTWHYVETLSPSVSLSTWSHDYTLYDHMNSIYRHDHKFDLVHDPRGQMFILRLYLDMMVHQLYGFNETTQFFVRLVSNRFSGLEHLFPPSEDDPLICDSGTVRGKIPTCVHVHGYAKLDMKVISGHFRALEPDVMDILFLDYVEEITAQVVGVKKMLAFFRYCFRGQEYYITDIGDEEHSLWDHQDLEPDSV